MKELTLKENIFLNLVSSWVLELLATINKDSSHSLTEDEVIDVTTDITKDVAKQIKKGECYDLTLNDINDINALKEEFMCSSRTINLYFHEEFKSSAHLIKVYLKR